ncbi:tripartite tricarboxylate transporter TctB family protein [Halocynthiibacter sp. C4]|uniref:tripartite tricarboxylate transporter TctB family protein n=1 Tax=Halocynthiibacter sp. C4 TaxID=2992758 RepID=UPI00237BE409|nr:tripartite tricarboxylate transporter TctB family protein [Halocynthiibacter sp. C4]MDE0589151.1 tripartite tricarboxylate transporter TctB family protein [Halocynthiibacter sp. C4]
MLRMKTADVVTGLVLCILGIAMVIGGYTMDRLEIRSIHPASIPGLVPMILGVLLAICGALLTFTSLNKSYKFDIDVDDPKMLFTALGLCLGFALVLLGWIPFAIATFIFITLASYFFRESRGETTKDKALTFVKSIAFAAIMSAAISALFRYAFLVRLP